MFVAVVVAFLRCRGSIAYCLVWTVPRELVEVGIIMRLVSWLRERRLGTSQSEFWWKQFACLAVTRSCICLV